MLPDGKAWESPLVSSDKNGCVIAGFAGKRITVLEINIDTIRASGIHPGDDLLHQCRHSVAV